MKSGQLIDPALFLESLFKHIGNFLGSLIVPALNRVFTSLLPVDTHPSDDDESHRVVCGN